MIESEWQAAGSSLTTWVSPRSQKERPPVFVALAGGGRGGWEPPLLVEPPRPPSEPERDPFPLLRRLAEACQVAGEEGAVTAECVSRTLDSVEVYV